MTEPLASDPVRIAVWSGPRNISTALLRAWGSRADTHVTDEPLYAAYLAATGKDHPGRADILASQPTDWREVAAHLTGPLAPPDQGPGQAPASGEKPTLWVQKHMAHHLLPEMGRDWLDGFRHAFLIRDPAAMLASLVKVIPDAQLEDTGLPQQVELFERTADRLGYAPPVLDGRAVRAAPEAQLRALCAALDVPWDPAMLSWAPGPRETDGVWGPVWYQRLYTTTGFEPPEASGGAADAPEITVPESLAPVLEVARPLYDRLAE
ncbi:MAG: hypothetical protein AAFQ43_08470, partial [Bacteroidota bacterium]